MLHKIAGRVSSQLKKEEGAEVVAEQACYLPCTTDGLPVIVEMPGVKGCYVATTGHSCWDILNAPATGAALAELILDARPRPSILHRSVRQGFSRGGAGMEPDYV
jgi:glycine/D-amino acid oxidase-like deaminating enzyme